MSATATTATTATTAAAAAAGTNFVSAVFLVEYPHDNLPNVYKGRCFVLSATFEPVETDAFLSSPYAIPNATTIQVVGGRLAARDCLPDALLIASNAEPIAIEVSPFDRPGVLPAPVSITAVARVNVEPMAVPSNPSLASFSLSLDSEGQWDDENDFDLVCFGSAAFFGMANGGQPWLRAGEAVSVAGPVIVTASGMFAMWWSAFTSNPFPLPEAGNGGAPNFGGGPSSGGGSSGGPKPARRTKGAFNIAPAGSAEQQQA